jgi:hypothetical protein
MKKTLLAILFILVLALSTPAFSAYDWQNAGTPQVPGSINASDIDFNLQNYVTGPLDTLLSNYRSGALLTYNSAATIDVTAGEVVCSNSTGLARKFRKTTSTTSATFAANLDTGSEAASTTYYVYANCDADATTFAVKFSASSTTPTGVTSYLKLGSFYNNSSSNISYIQNYTGVEYEYLQPSDTSEGTSYSADVSYQNTTSHKTLIVVYAQANNDSNWFTRNVHCYIGETSSPATEVAKSVSHESSVDVTSYPSSESMTFIVPAGWYWKVANTAYNSLTVPTLRIEAWEI